MDQKLIDGKSDHGASLEDAHRIDPGREVLEAVRGDPGQGVEGEQRLRALTVLQREGRPFRVVQSRVIGRAWVRVIRTSRADSLVSTMPVFLASGDGVVRLDATARNSGIPGERGSARTTLRTDAPWLRTPESRTDRSALSLAA